MSVFDIEVFNGGRFISRGKGRHQNRCIDSDELIFCVKGSLSMFEEDEIFELNAGDYLILEHGKRHGGLSDYSGGLSFFWVHFLDRGNIFEHIAKSGRVQDKEQMSLYLQSFLKEQQRDEPVKAVSELIFNLILFELKRTCNDLPSTARLTKNITAAAELIRLHFAEPLTVDTAAKILHCSSEYLGRAFHRYYGATFAAELNRTRVEHAAKLLTESCLSVKEIIAETGFNDPAYFRRMFYRRYAMTPTDFRKFYAGGHLNTD